MTVEGTDKASNEKARRGRASRPFVAITSRPRLTLGAVVGAIIAFSSPASWTWSTRWIVGWDALTVLFLALVLLSWRHANVESMRKKAIAQDEGRHLVLVLAMIGVVASVAAIVSEVSIHGPASPALHRGRLALGFVTIGLSWLFMQAIFALHYAHEYYAPNEADEKAQRKGLLFPGGEAPDYWDFFHFALTIGAAVQTADIAIASKVMRRTVTVHTLLSYGFNMVVIALAVGAATTLF